jgi:hypothetical protein
VSVGEDRRFLERLLERMTLGEKVGQLSLYSADVALAGSDPANPVPTFDVWVAPNAEAGTSARFTLEAP